MKARHSELTDVKEIVTNAVNEAQVLLEAKYDNFFAEKIREQHEAFTQFNQDFMDDRLKESPSEYFS